MLRLAGLVLATILPVAVTPTVAAAPVESAVVVRIGDGAARLTRFSDGTARLYLNLKGLVPGRWNAHLWTGTCSDLGARVAVLPGLAVPASGAIARTNPLTQRQALGRTLRVVSGARVLCATFGAGSFAPTGAVQAATVVRVVDGDTIVVDRGHGQETLRYIGIDTPETVHPSRPVEWMGAEASRANASLVGGRQVILERDISETDQYGRLLRYVWTRTGSDWTLVNLALVATGFAQVDTYPPDVKYAQQFLDAQRAAREQGLGLWGTPPSPARAPSPSPLTPASPPRSGCDPAYPTVCIRPPPPDLDCGDIVYRRFVVLAPDPHRFDGDGDGIGCESG